MTTEIIREGVIWQEPDTKPPRALADVIASVRETHLTRLGEEPVTVLVHPNNPFVADGPVEVNGIVVKAGSYIQPSWYFAIRREYAE